MKPIEYSRIQTKNILAAGLKQAWPGVKFTIKICKWERLLVEWVEGPPESEVAPIVHQFSTGTFDGMIDLYEYDRGSVQVYCGAGRGELQRWRWTSVRRTLTDEYKRPLIAALEENWGRAYNECSTFDRFRLDDDETAMALRLHPRQPSPILDSIFYVPEDETVEAMFAVREASLIAAHVQPTGKPTARSLRI